MSDTTKGLAGVTAADTSLSRVDGENGELIYRGYDIRELGAQATFEEVIYLLWDGDLPTQAELKKIKAELAANRLTSPRYAVSKGLGSGATSCQVV